ncbi:MAG: glucose-1-phosphate adenylyltransferase [bacterium]|nr:glucose-1-phosphate adenylyltransferase [bacterium]
MKSVLAIILGGGQGSRLFPLTKYRSKPAVPIGGKFRLIDIPISNCIHSNVRKIYILTQFNTLSLHRHITSTFKFDGFSKGFVQILAAQQTIENKNWYQGTADAVRKNIEYIKHQKADYVAILSGDQLYRINLREFISYHRQKKADVTIASKPIDRNEAKSFGILKMDEAHKITDFVEKPQEDEVLDSLYLPSEKICKNTDKNFVASMGIYIFNKATLLELLEANLDYEDFGKQIIPASMKTHKVYSYIFNGYWEDIGTVKSFFDSNLDFASVVPKFNFYDENNPIYTNARFLPSSKIKDCEIHHALLSDGSILEGSKITDSTIGLRSIIKKGSTLERVVMMGADFYGSAKSVSNSKIGIGKNCFLKNVILDKNATIGDNSVIDYKGDPTITKDGGFYHISDGIVIIPKNGKVPANTRIE